MRRLDTVRVYFRSRRLLNAVFGAARGAFDGLWLGMLSPDHLTRIDETYYHACVEYVDDAYNHGGLWHWEQRALETHFAGVHRVAVTSAGGGREVLALLEQGWDATGYEPNDDLARFGSRLTEAAGHGPRVLPCRRDRWPSTSPDTEGAVVGWGGYMLIAGRRRRIEFLLDAAAGLPAGAPILLSFFTRPRHRLRWRSTTTLGNVLRRLRGDEPLEIGDALDPNFVHYFTRAEVLSELDAAGLDLVDFGDDDYGWAVGRVRGGLRQEGAAA